MLFNRLAIECQQKSSLELGKKYGILNKTIKSNEELNMIAKNIDEHTQYVCNKVWKLLQISVNGGNELDQRLNDIQVNNITFSISILFPLDFILCRHIKTRVY